MAKTTPSLPEILKLAGYIRHDSGHDALWKISTPEKSGPVNVKFEILERKGQFHISKCKVRIDHAKMIAKIHAIAKKRFGKIISSLEQPGNDGKIRLIFEIAPQAAVPGTRPGNHRGSMGTTIGWTMAITHFDDRVSIQFTDVFSLGDDRKNWWVDILDCVGEAVTPGYRQFMDIRNIQEIAFPVIALPVIPPSSGKAAATRDLECLSAIKLPTSLRTTTDIHATVIESVPGHDIAESATSMEILRIRETSAAWLELDATILHRKSSSAYIKKITWKDSDTLTRVGACPDLIPPPDLASAAELLASVVASPRDHSLLALTGASRLAAVMGTDTDRVHVISELLRMVAIAYGPLHAIKPLARIAPELLGDCWAMTNPDTAFKSWNAALQSGVRNPRIHRKIADLAQATDNVPIEFRSLLALSELERRKEALEAIAPRLMALASSHPDLLDQNASEYLTALNVLSAAFGSDGDIILAIVNLMIKRGEHQKALKKLDACLNSSRSSLSNKDLARLNAAMAEIWHKCEGDTHLASARYVFATTSPAEPSDDILAAAEAFFSGTNNPAQFRRILKLRSARSDQGSGVDALERSARYLADQGLAGEALAEIIKILETGRARQWYLDVLDHAMGLTDIDWDTTSRKFLNANLADLPADSIPAWQLMAGRAAMKSKKSETLGIETLTKDRVIPLLTTGESTLIQTRLLRDKNAAAIRGFISRRVQTCGREEYRGLIQTVVQENIYSDDGIFEHGVAELAAEDKSLAISRKRVAGLIRDRQRAGLIALMRAHAATFAGSRDLTEFHTLVLSLLASSHAPDFTGPLEPIIDEATADSDLSESDQSERVELMIRCGFLKLAEEVLKTEITAGRVVLTDEATITSILIDQPQLLALWHNIGRARAKNPRDRHHHARAAVKYWIATNDRPPEMIDAIMDLVDEPGLALDIFQLLETLCRQNDRMPEFIKTLERRIPIVPPEDQAALLHWAMRTVIADLKDPVWASKIFKNHKPDTPGSFIDHCYTQGYLAYMSDNLPEAQTNFIAMLEAPEVLSMPDLLLATIDILSKCKVEKTRFATIVQTLVSWSRSGQDTALTAELVRRAISWNIAGIDDLNREFLAGFPHESVDRLANIATQTLAKAERLPNGVQKSLTEWQDSAEIRQNRGKWNLVIESMCASGLHERLRRSARIEILHLHAQNLAESDARRLDAIPFYEAMSRENPMDYRAWIPLYSLYEEAGSYQNLISHLDRVIPLLQQNKSVLDRTPFNIESLQNSLKRAREQHLAARDHKSAQSLKPNDPTRPIDLMSRARKIQENLDREMQAFRVEPLANPDQLIEIAPTAMNGANHLLIPTSAERADSEKTAGVAPAAEIRSLTGTSASQTTAVDPSTSFQQGYYDGATAPNLIIDPGLSIPREFTGPNNQMPSSSQLSLPPLSTEESRAPQSALNINWRRMIEDGTPVIGSTERIMTMAFASEIEKHVAVQCVALLSAETKLLETWHWPVWRKMETRAYPLSPANRQFIDPAVTLYGGPLHNLLRLISPVLMRTLPHKFLIQGKLTKLGLRADTRSRPVALNHPVLSRSWLPLFNGMTNSLKARFMDTPGLGAEVFFDIKTRCLHFDAQWQLSRPPGVLSYRALELLLSFQRGHAGIVNLDPATEIMPIINEIKGILSASGMNKLRIAFGIQQRNLNDQLKQLNREQLVSLLTENNAASPGEIAKLQSEMRLNTLTLLLASTLDVVGILESLTGSDLCDANILTPTKILNIHPLARQIILAATKLTL